MVSIFVISNQSHKRHLMAFKKTFLVSDESVNTYGFAVRTVGIRLENAKKNCPAFYEHDTDDIPLGHWENFKKEGVKLYADLVIEGANEAEKTYIRKIQNGDIKGASIGADPITWNSDPLQLQQGQTMPWLEESDLFEISITALPGNQNALALKKDGCVVKLNSTNTTLFFSTKKTEPDMKQVALKLGLHENATENEIVNAIKDVQLKAAHAEAMQKVIDEQVATQLEGEHKDFFISLSKTNMGEAMKFLMLNKKIEETTAGMEGASSAPGAPKVIKDVRVSKLLKPGASMENNEKDKEGKNTFDYLQKHNVVELRRIKKEDPERYAQLAADYGAGIRYKGK